MNTVIDHSEKKKSSRNVFKAKIIFIITTLVIATISTIIFIVGPKNIYNDLFTITAVLSVILLLFLTYGLYHGFNIHDDMPDLISKIKFKYFFDLFPVNHNIDLDFSEGPLGIIFSIVAWLLITIFFSIVIAFLLASAWALLIILIIAFYWIFYRALRLVFMKSEISKGDLTESLKYGVLYTVLYSVWFYGIIYFSKVIKSN